MGTLSSSVFVFFYRCNMVDLSYLLVRERLCVDFCMGIGVS